MEVTPIPEGEKPSQRVAIDPPVTTSTNTTNKKNLGTKPCTNMRRTRNNIPGTVPTIPDTQHLQIQSTCLNPHLQRNPTKVTAPNSTHISFAAPKIISQEAVNLITDNVY